MTIWLLIGRFFLQPYEVKDAAVKGHAEVTLPELPFGGECNSDEGSSGFISERTFFYIPQG